MRSLLAGLVSLFCLASSVTAQDGGLNLFQLQTPAVSQVTASKVEIGAILVPTTQAGIVQLQVRMIIPEGMNSYSMDPSFAKPTKIALEETGWKMVDGAYGITPPPKKEHDDNFDKVVEKLFGTVIFSRRMALPAGVDPASVTLKGEIHYLLCDKDNCLPKKASFTASVVATKKLDALEEEAFRATEAAVSMTPVETKEEPAPVSTVTSPLASGYEIVPQKIRNSAGVQIEPVRIQFELSPATATVGETVTVAITMTLADKWSTYGLEKAAENQIEMPTVISFTPSHLAAVGGMVSVPQPEVVITRLQDGDHPSNSHVKQVSWTQEFQVTDNAPFGVSGSIRYQICEKEKSCLPPKTVKFQLGSAQQESIAGASPIVRSYFGKGEHDSLQSAATPMFTVESTGEETTLWSAMATAFLAGLLMNIMPCVLPVLAIKILSFVQQAGEKRSRILALNLAYTGGVLAVFMLFAFLSVILGQSMGAVFQSTPFMIGMAAVVFVMGLSLFGVFELPVPGIIPSAGHHQEGYLGAINTGVIATILGTPCIAPFVATVFTWGLSQPPVIVFGMFGLMGLGMAFPFIVTGLVPSLVNRLPRPGNWMVKFKQFTGFVMMGTVIWLLFNVAMEWRVPVLVMLLGLALFVWLCANLTTPADRMFRRLVGCVGAGLISFPVIWAGFWLMQEFTPSSLAGQNTVAAAEPGDDVHHKMPWEPFSEDMLIQLRQAGKPVLIDFTANWCVICKINEKIALDRQETIEFVKAHNIVPMMADFTKENPEILKYLRMFGQDSVPLTVIIPPGKESKVIAIRGQYTKGILMDKLKEAVDASAARTADRNSITSAVR